MNDDTGSARRPRLEWPLRTGLLAATACIAPLATACGGSPSAAPGGLAAYQQALPFAQCMRAHGIGNFPDPDASGNFAISNLINQNSAQYAAAKATCVRLHPYNMVLSPQQDTAIMSRALEFARCMRAHGVPNFPDPTQSRGRITFGGQTTPSAPPPVHRDSSAGTGSGQRGPSKPATGAPRPVTSPASPPESPQYLAAMRACRSFAGKGRS